MNFLRYSIGLVLGAVFFMSIPNQGKAENTALEAKVRERAASIEAKLVAWRRDIHQHPELGDQENRTARLVTEHLRSLGLEVRTGIARMGVIGILKGAKPSRNLKGWRLRPTRKGGIGERKWTSCMPADTTRIPPC